MENTSNAVANTVAFNAQVTFRTQRDKEGNVVKEGHAPVAFTLVRPSNDYLISLLGQGSGKEFDLLIEAVEEIIFSEAKGFVAKNPDNDPATFPYAQWTWQAIAAQERESAARASITKEELQAFCDSYIVVIQRAAGKTEEQATKAAVIFGSRFKDYKKVTSVLEKLQEGLVIYAGEPEAADHIPVVEMLAKKLTEYLQDTAEAMAAAL